jgi:hypothetical protein
MKIDQYGFRHLLICGPMALRTVGLSRGSGINLSPTESLTRAPQARVRSTERTRFDRFNGRMMQVLKEW